jgi:hypothetical protein
MPEMEIKLAEDSELGRRGELVKLSLTPADVHEASEMPTFLAGYTPPEYRADEFAPVVLVDKDSDKYRVFDADDAFLLVAVKASQQQAVPEIQPTSSLTTYDVVDRFVGSFIGEITEANAAPNYRPRQVSMKRCKRAIALDVEVDWWTAICTLTNWGSSQRVTLGATQKWNGGAASDPIKDLHTRIEASDQLVTDIAFNPRVANAFLRHSLVRDHMRQMIGDNAPNAALAAVSKAAEQRVDFAIPGLPPFHVVPAKYRTAAGGATSYVMADDVVLLTKPAAGVPNDGEEISTAYRFRRRGVAGVGYETREFRVENRGPKGGTMVVASEASDLKITASTAGGLIKDAWQ